MTMDTNTLTQQVASLSGQIDVLLVGLSIGAFVFIAILGWITHELKNNLLRIENKIDNKVQKDEQRIARLEARLDVLEKRITQ